MVSLTDAVCAEYSSPLGDMILTSSNGVLCGAWFTDQKYACAGISPCETVPLSHSFFCEVSLWLDRYFRGNTSAPDFPLEPAGTAFQKAVWAELLKIPYGCTRSYKDVAESIGCKSARAAGLAIGRNPISIIIPCHRVIGSSGALTGYAGGLERKAKLLDLEKTYLSAS